MVVRSWNLFHGNAVPPQRRAYLEEVVRLVTADRPDLVFLQEVPLWALPELGRWSGMQAFGNRAAPARLGPLPSTPGIGKALTDVNHGLLRSAFTGQANAILAAPGLRPAGRRHLVTNDRRFRRAQARWLELGIVARLAWAKERRVCQALRLVLGDGRTVLATNTHATSYEPDSRLAEAEVFRAATFVDALAEPGEAIVFGGDLNAFADRSTTLRELTSPEWGFERFGEGVDHLLVRGATLVRGEAWPTERRRVGGRLLSDHPPVEVVIE